jgi:acyl-CoA reductase-like NAD-dependent aldehyde dehydrogenase
VTLNSGLAGESITAGNDAALIVDSFLKHAVNGICKGAFLATVSCCAAICLETVVMTTVLTKI